MPKAKILMDSRIDISERYRVELKVWQVEPNSRYPEGVKARFVLIDVLAGQPRLLLDNHEPYGFHVHTDLPNMKNARRRLKTRDYSEALDEFWQEVREII